MSILLHGDCLEKLQSVDDNSVDFIFCDLPYGQTSCAWDTIIPWDPFWKEILRVKKLNTPIFFTTTTKFGVELINNAPKKCPFRYDLVWVKSAPAGFLSAKKMPMRKHEMVYCFYEKLPLYDLSSHKHKFITEPEPEPEIKYDQEHNSELYGNIKRDDRKNKKVYDPPLPVSVIKKVERDSTYGSIKTHDLNIKGDTGVPRYDPPLPVSVVKEESKEDKYANGTINSNTYDIPNKSKGGMYRSPAGQYDPPLPVSVVKEEAEINKVERKSAYGNIKTHDIKTGKNNAVPRYDPPLPVSVVKEEQTINNYKSKRVIYKDENGNIIKEGQTQGDRNKYDPPLPNSILEVKSTRGKHSTEKPIALMSWLLKYFSKEGDTVLDPTMGSGSTGVACKNMNRNFIGIEKDPEIYEVAVNRIEN